MENFVKIKFVVISVDEKRKIYMEEQFKNLGLISDVSSDMYLKIDIEYFQGFTPSNSIEYINFKDEKSPEFPTTICCFRSYIAVFEKYKNDEIDYIITVEDDISIITTDFIKKLEEYINLWKKHPQPEYISLGYNLSCNFEDFKNMEHENDFYFNMTSYSKLWGSQMLLFKKETLSKLSMFYKENSLEVHELLTKIVSDKKYFSKKYPRIQIDAVLPLVCKYGMIYPPLAIENNGFVSTITNIMNSQSDLFKNHPDVNFSEYYGINF